jgi:RNA polymerase subunit RPABC4/transcription elongation factor Spt4
MIGEGPTLNESLPSQLKEALDEELQPGERAVVTVRAQPREALAATPTRLLILREDSAIMGRVSIASYPLTEIEGIELREGGAGPQLAWQMAGEAEAETLEVPPYDAAKFRMVAEALRGMMTRGAASAPAPTAMSRCPKCGTGLPEATAFCPACGLQTRDTCWECSRPLETEWRFCPACGGETTELGVVPCPSCREPVGREHAYCVRCGAQARLTCGECDRILRRSWQHCPDCGTPASGDDGGSPATRPEPPRAARREREPVTRFAAEAPAQPAGNAAEAEAVNQRGFEAYERERFEEAVDFFRRAVELSPTNATFHCNLAVALWETGRDEEAFAEYQRTLALDPANARALVEMGSLYAQQEQYEEARDCWERAIRVAPESSEATEARQNLENPENL